MVAGKTILITGSTDGVGKLVAKQLAGQGAKVLLHGRDPAKGGQVLAQIAAETGNDTLEYFNADLASLENVRKLAEQILAKHGRIDVLVNNAGVGGGAHGPLLASSGPVERTGAAVEAAHELERSADGYELRLAVNHLAAFLLTNLLLPALRKSSDPRVVAVSSIGQSPIDFDDPMLTSGQDSMHAYRQSKFAQVMFSFELADRLADTGLTAVALHPASFMNTKMVAESGIEPKSTVEEGAAAIMKAITDPSLARGRELFFNGQAPMRAKDEQAYDPATRDRFWKLSEQLTGMS